MKTEIHLFNQVEPSIKHESPIATTVCELTDFCLRELQNRFETKGFLRKRLTAMRHTTIHQTVFSRQTSGFDKLI